MSLKLLILCCLLATANILHSNVVSAQSSPTEGNHKEQKVLEQIAIDIWAERHRSAHMVHFPLSTKVHQGYETIPSKLTVLQEQIFGNSDCEVSLHLRLIKDYRRFRSICLFKDDFEPDTELFDTSLKINVEGADITLENIHNMVNPITGFIAGEPNSVVKGYLIANKFYGTIRLYDKYRLYHIVFYVEPISNLLLYNSHLSAKSLKYTDSDNAIIFEYISHASGSGDAGKTDKYTSRTSASSGGRKPDKTSTKPGSTKAPKIITGSTRLIKSTRSTKETKTTSLAKVTKTTGSAKVTKTTGSAKVTKSTGSTKVTKPGSTRPTRNTFDDLFTHSTDPGDSALTTTKPYVHSTLKETTSTTTSTSSSSTSSCTPSHSTEMPFHSTILATLTSVLTSTPITTPKKTTTSTATTTSSTTTTSPFHSTSVGTTYQLLHSTFLTYAPTPNASYFHSTSVATPPNITHSTEATRTSTSTSTTTTTAPTTSTSTTTKPSTSTTSTTTTLRPFTFHSTKVYTPSTKITSRRSTPLSHSTAVTPSTSTTTTPESTKSTTPYESTDPLDFTSTTTTPLTHSTELTSTSTTTKIIPPHSTLFTTSTTSTTSTTTTTSTSTTTSSTSTTTQSTTTTTDKLSTEVTTPSTIFFHSTEKSITSLPLEYWVNIIPFNSSLIFPTLQAGRAISNTRLEGVIIDENATHVDIKVFKTDIKFDLMKFHRFPVTVVNQTDDLSRRSGLIVHATNDSQGMLEIVVEIIVEPITTTIKTTTVPTTRSTRSTSTTTPVHSTVDRGHSTDVTVTSTTTATTKAPKTTVRTTTKPTTKRPTTTARKTTSTSSSTTSPMAVHSTVITTPIVRSTLFSRLTATSRTSTSSTTSRKTVERKTTRRVTTIRSTRSTTSTQKNLVHSTEASTPSTPILHSTDQHRTTITTRSMTTTGKIIPTSKKIRITTKRTEKTTVKTTPSVPKEFHSTVQTTPIVHSTEVTRGKKLPTPTPDGKSKKGTTKSNVRTLAPTTKGKGRPPTTPRPTVRPTTKPTTAKLVTPKKISPHKPVYSTEPIIPPFHSTESFRLPTSPIPPGKKAVVVIIEPEPPFMPPFNANILDKNSTNMIIDPINPSKNPKEIVIPSTIIIVVDNKTFEAKVTGQNGSSLIIDILPEKQKVVIVDPDNKFKFANGTARVNETTMVVVIDVIDPPTEFKKGEKTSVILPDGSKFNGTIIDVDDKKIIIDGNVIPPVPNKGEKVDVIIHPKTINPTPAFTGNVTDRNSSSMVIVIDPTKTKEPEKLKNQTIIVIDPSGKEVSGIITDANSTNVVVDVIVIVTKTTTPEPTVSTTPYYSTDPMEYTKATTEPRALSHSTILNENDVTKSNLTMPPFQFLGSTEFSYPFHSTERLPKGHIPEVTIKPHAFVPSTEFANNTRNIVTTKPTTAKKVTTRAPTTRKATTAKVDGKTFPKPVHSTEGVWNPTLFRSTPVSPLASRMSPGILPATNAKKAATGAVTQKAPVTKAAVPVVKTEPKANPPEAKKVTTQPPKKVVVKPTTKGYEKFWSSTEKMAVPVITKLSTDPARKTSPIKSPTGARTDGKNDTPFKFVGSTEVLHENETTPLPTNFIPSTEVSQNLGKSSTPQAQATGKRRRKRDTLFNFNKFFGENAISTSMDNDISSDIGFRSGHTNSDIFDIRNEHSSICQLCIWIQPHFAEAFGLSGGILHGISEIIDIIKFTNWIFRAIDFNQDGIPENIGLRIKNIILTDSVSLKAGTDASGSAGAAQAPQEKNTKSPSGGSVTGKAGKRRKRRAASAVRFNAGKYFGSLVNNEIDVDSFVTRKKRGDAFDENYDIPGFFNDESEEQEVEERRNMKPKAPAVVEQKDLRDTLNEFARDPMHLTAQSALLMASRDLSNKFEGCCAILGFMYHDMMPSVAAANERGLCGPNNVGLISGFLHNHKINKYDVYRGVMHSLGHLFGATHNSITDPDCVGNKLNEFLDPFPMDPIQQINVGIRPNSFRFSNCAKDQITMFLSSSGSTCLQNDKTEFCGNGELEAGESCDCGSPWQCHLNFPCCGERDSLMGCKIVNPIKHSCHRPTLW